MISNVNKNLNLIETGFNIAGGLPFVALISGSLRSYVGTAQMTVGLGLTIIGAIGHLAAGKEDARWSRTIKLGIEHMLAGVLNTIRGVGEAFLALYTLGISNLVLFVVQYNSKEGFAPVFEYGAITENKQCTFGYGANSLLNIRFQIRRINCFCIT